MNKSANSHKSKFKNFANSIIKWLVILAVFACISIAFMEIPKKVYPLKYESFVYKYSNQYNLDPYLVFAVIKTESSFNSNALSGKKAKGLMQITDKTGKWGASDLKIKNFDISQLYDPETNIRIGTWYLNKLMKQFGGNVELVTAAYNGGSGNVDQWLKDNSLSDGNKLSKIPFQETENFVKNVKNNYKMYKILYDTDL